MELENHPIPQDVSHFQFKLIGSMTVKQLGYVGTGFIFAWIFYALPIYFLIKIPLVLFYPILGITLAFIPIEGRPADLMVYYFIKALFEANQYVFHKGSTNSLLSSMSQHTLIHQNTVINQNAPNTRPTVQENKPEETVFLESTGPVDSSSSPEDKTFHEAITSPMKVQPVHDIRDMENEEEIEKEKIENLSHQLAKEKERINEDADQGEEQQPDNTVHEKVSQLEELLNNTRLEKEKLEKEIHMLRQQTVPIAPIPTQAQKPLPADSKKPSTSSLPVPEIPNLITGSIKDSRGNILPNILIEIKDKESNPVRAFKTNQLGQFASATPLLNGTYTIDFEDTQNNHKFDTIEVVVDGQIIIPLEIVSIDQREELRKSLFG